MNGMILLLDNYDSFVHNLARHFRLLGHETAVVRSDSVDVDDVRRLDPAAIVLSPGPKRPEDAGCCLAVVRAFADRLPILGVCLGHQAIGQAFGGRIVCTRPQHGRSDLVTHRGEGLFAGLPSPLRVARYHSLAVEPASLPAEFRATAVASDGTVMAIQHRHWPVQGVQFHPESVLTEHGLRMLQNFCASCQAAHR